MQSLGGKICLCNMQAALDMDVEDINAHLQRQDALNMLKRMPKRQPNAAPPLAEAPISTTDADDGINSEAAAGTA